MRKLRFPVTAVIVLALAVPALAMAGHSTYHKIKGGSLAVKVSAAEGVEQKPAAQAPAGIGAVADHEVIGHGFLRLSALLRREAGRGETNSRGGDHHGA